MEVAGEFREAYLAGEAVMRIGWIDLKAKEGERTANGLSLCKKTVRDARKKNSSLSFSLLSPSLFFPSFIFWIDLLQRAKGAFRSRKGNKGEKKKKASRRSRGRGRKALPPHFLNSLSPLALSPPQPPSTNLSSRSRVPNARGGERKR